MKPGYKTSEFWLNLFVFLLGAALASGVIADGGTVAKAIGGALSLLSSLGYTMGRVGVKRADSLGAAYVNGPTNSNSPIAAPITVAPVIAPDPTKESA